MRYGIPYLGSKNGIAERIVALLPTGRRFVDLFAGGCAVTHAAMLSGKWKSFLARDADWRPISLFRDAVSGVLPECSKWISREEFQERKKDNPYVRYCWSFGNNGEGYIYGKEIEPRKKAVHEAVFDGEFEGLRSILPEESKAVEKAVDSIPIPDWRRRMRKVFGVLSAFDRSGRKFPDGMNYSRMYCLEHIRHFLDLSGLHCAFEIWKTIFNNNFDIVNSSYDSYEYEEGDVVYCDPPYDTKGGERFYNGGFDFEAFREWLRSRDYPVYVSEYSMPDDFVAIGKFRKVSTYCATRNFPINEKVFVHRKWNFRPYGLF